MAAATELFLFLVITIVAFGLYLINLWILNLEIVANPPENFAWIVHGIRNMFGYATVFLPGYILYKYVTRSNYLNKSGRGLFGGVIRTCFGEELLLLNPTANDKRIIRTPFQYCILLLFYFFGLQVSYLSWGVLQEKIMTQQYDNGTGEKGHFKDSQFLVFVNRILAFIIALVVLMCTKQLRHKCPLYKYLFCSFSNIMSSWCQYEALKYVSFPHQVLAKASKTIPVMIMGKVVLKEKYATYEYIFAVILSIGMICFMLDTGNDRANSTVTTFSGVILLCLYILFDSFTSNWQGKLFQTYKMKPVQMMCFVNFFSSIFTLVALLQHGGFLESLKFMFTYQQFIFDSITLSLCSAAGQMFIFHTIETFGPLVFVIISTIRQCLSVLLSCIIYQHHVDVLGNFGLFLVFFSMLLKIYYSYRLKKIKQQNVGLSKN